MCIPRINYAMKVKNSPLWDIGLCDWSDAKFPTIFMLPWCEYNGVYCAVETKDNLEQYSELLFPGIATTCFEEMPYSTYVDQMKG